MTDKIALGLGLVILSLLGLDYFMADSANLLFVLKKMTDLIEYIAFWR
ncbi:MAG: hypothetical protein CSA70_08680 [Rhodobacterales bacterium]|nr:MAG: hypothetical protein CSA70_08680 [Rhodobacterales bacterium]